MNLYQDLMGQTQQQQPNPQPNNFMSNLANFAQNFNGDPRETAMKLIQQRNVPQNELNSAIQQTNQIYGMLRGGR